VDKLLWQAFRSLQLRLVVWFTTGMADSDLRDQIARIESDIEQLSDVLERCRKTVMLSKLPDPVRPGATSVGPNAIGT
jgi:hypothetical protein